MMSYPCPGIRVVRGPGWSGKDQDGGEGHVGTVVKIGNDDYSKGKVTVIWDCGREFQYQAGNNDKFDLLVFDSGPSGVAQTGFTCDGCGENPIIGIRWKCEKCTDFDLCSLCYNTEKHDLSHPFLRCLTLNAPCVRVQPRANTPRIQALGLFKGARVMRGPHWSYGNQDGEEGNVGEVLKLGAWTGGYSRGAVNVRWGGGQDTIKGYKIGAMGKVDLITVDERLGWKYYKSHLPVLDVLNPEDIKLLVGDKIAVQVDEKIFERMHRDIAGYKDSMKQCLEETGTVVRIPDKDPRVIVAQYEDAEKYVLVKNTLTRLHSFAVGDTVRIINNYNAAVELQQGHGGWNDKMEECLGKQGKVIEIDKDRDMRIQFSSHKWFFSPVSCIPQDKRYSLSDPGTSSGSSSSSSGSEVDAIAEEVARVLVDLLKPGESALFRPGALTGKPPVTAQDLMKSVGDGDIEAVKKIIASRGDVVNEDFEGMTALQVACHKGEREIAELLINAKADLNKGDKEGDTPLHYAVSGEQPLVAELLLKSQADKNKKNGKGLTPLHVVVAKRSHNLEVLKRLVMYKCDPNTQDDDGDTPLHDAIRAGSKPVLDMFLKYPDLDLKLFNNEGNNPFHEACCQLEGDTEFPLALIQRDRTIVDVPNGSLLTPLHVAAYNGFVALTGELLKAKCNVNAKDANGKTPLHLAVEGCHSTTVELLTESGAEVNCQDNDGNTPLHAAHMEADGGKDDDKAPEIRCYLVEHGGNIKITNTDGKTPLYFVKNKEVRVMMERIARRSSSSTLTSTRRRLPAHWVQMVDGYAKVRLSPGDPVTAYEFSTVESLFEKTLSNTTIESLYRIQNVALWEQYSVAKANLERKYGKGLANELQLFHGTKPNSAEIILKQNIDFRLAGGRVGTRFGQGAYFAVDAKYSDKYSEPDANRHKFMFLAKVLVGKTRRGVPDYKRPPPLEDNDTKLADSTCDDEASPSIYVIYSEHQIYPEYLIEYS